jgi:hypothetical protein
VSCNYRLSSWVRVKVSKPERKDKPGTSKLHALSSTPYISATRTVISNLGTVLDSQPNFLQNGFLQFTFRARGSIAQRRATMGTAAYQRCATMGTVPIVAGVHMDRPQLNHLDPK